MAGDEGGWRRHVVEVELVLRQSCGCQPMDSTADEAAVLPV